MGSAFPDASHVVAGAGYFRPPLTERESPRRTDDKNPNYRAGIHQFLFPDSLTGIAQSWSPRISQGGDDGAD
jgi:hypothetical protein